MTPKPILPPRCKCGETDPAKFHRDRAKRNGYQSSCMKCSLRKKVVVEDAVNRAMEYIMRKANGTGN